jgi:hypothetical protein
MTHIVATFDALHSRFYEEGTESGSTPLGDEDANITITNLTINHDIQLRWLVQETAGGEGASTDDWRPQFDINGDGYNVLSSASLGIRSYGNSVLTDGAATTNRATNGLTDPGTGSFVAGECEDLNGIIEDLAVTASNFTELLYAIRVRTLSGELVNGDVVSFRLSYNGGSPGMVNSVTPQIQIGAASVTFSGTGLASTLAFGSGSVSGDVSLAGTGLASTLATGNGVVSGDVSLAGTGLASTLAFGTGAVTENVAFDGSGLGSTLTFGSGSLSGDVTFAGSSLSSTLDFGAGSLSGDVSLEGTGFASTLATGTGTVSGDAANVTLEGAGLASTLALGSGTTTGTVTFDGSAQSSTLAFGDGSISGDSTLVGSGLASTLDAGLGAVRGPVSLEGTGLASTISFGAGSIIEPNSPVTGSGTRIVKGGDFLLRI